jgi:uncharacterized protein (TIGR03437 family)
MLLASRLLLIALASTTLSAQFTGLATDASGNVLYFSTNHRQANTTQPFHGKIFRWDATSGLKLYRSIDRIPFSGFLGTLPRYTNPYDLFAVDLSADAKTLVINGLSDCVARCTYVEIVSASLERQGAEPITLTGTTRISANGQASLLRYRPGLGNSYLRDLQNNSSSRNFGNYYIDPSSRRVISNNFLGLTFDGSLNLTLVNFVTLRLLATHAEESPFEATLDAEGRVVVYTAFPTAGNTAKRRIIRQIDIDTGRRDTISPPTGDCYAPSLSLDGKTLLYLCSQPSGAQAYIHHIGEDTPLPLTALPNGIQSALLSGDGLVVFAVTNQGQLLRLDTQTLSTIEIVGRTPALDQPFSAATPGSLIRLTGVALGATTSFATVPTPANPLPLKLAGFELFLNETPLPLLQVSPTEVYAQIPWDFPTSETPAQLLPRSPTSYFQAPPRQLLVTRSSAQVWFQAATLPYPFELSQPLVLHTGFTSPVTKENPLRPGEIFHVIATGLGPTFPAVPTGQAAPLSPLSTLGRSLSCSATSHGIPQTVPGQPPSAPSLDLLFAGLAPGLVGLYQVDLRVPASLPPPVELSRVAAGAPSARRAFERLRRSIGFQ